MRGYFATTDFKWYEQLRRIPHLDEVNFWAPSGKAGLVSFPRGTPFFFQLKKPHYAIAGFGFLGPVTALPISLAWELFGESNGARSLAEMRARIAKYRAGGSTEPDPVIGCRTILEPHFFPPEEWVAIASDWKKNIVTGMGDDLTAGEGLRIWSECQARLRAHRLELPLAGATRDSAVARFGSEFTYHPRLGQGTFRVAVLDAYGRSCAVTTEHSLPVLEAAHIRPYAEGGEHRESNGLLLRADLHRLYDRGYVTVTPEYRFEVSGRLREEWANGRVYYDLAGREIRVPDDPALRPDREQLAWHREERFIA
jgi:putative restriction endonuclease